MCLHPNHIPNPVFHKGTYASEHGTLVSIPRYLVPNTEYITVPCGKCADCRNSYYNSILQRALVESLTSYVYFVTLTYDNAHLPVLTLPTGQDIYYADYSDIQLMFKRFRDSGVLDREFRYLCATEYGDTFSRPHFHLLLFVGKRPEDDIITPHTIEKILFDNLQKYYARNIGTRKQPVYEKLFTYKFKYTTTGVKTNYFVKYVQPTNFTNVTKDSSQDSTTLTKTIRYLIGYVNKGSSFDDTVVNLLQDVTDSILLQKLKNLLRSKLRFSKGFGFGYNLKGEKDFLPKISVRASSSSVYWSDFKEAMPSCFSDFVDLHPELLSEFQYFVQKDIYKRFNSLEDALNCFTSSDYLCHCILIHYFPRYFSTIYDRYYRHRNISTPSISYFFDKRKYRYYKPTVYTSHPNTKSFTYQYLRSGVDQALGQGVPYLSFRNVADGSFTALCKFYKDRVCTVNDIATLFLATGSVDYDHWQSKFVNYIDLKKANMAQSRKLTHHNFDEIILKSQKSYLHLPRKLEGIDLFINLVSNCK